MRADSVRMLDEIQRLGARAVEQARARNRRLGIPNVSVRDGRLIEELPDGNVRPVEAAPAEFPTAEKKRRAF